MGIFLLSLIFTAVLVFGILFFLFKKYRPGKDPIGNIYFWITTIIAAPAFYIGVLLIWFFISTSYEKKIFDQEQWAADEHTRYEYVDDLINNEKLIGLTKQELTTMLGTADADEDSLMIFYIGYSPKTFINLDPDWLEAEISDGKVTHAYVRD